MTVGFDFIEVAFGSILAAVGEVALVKALGTSNLDGNVLMFIGLTRSVFYAFIRIGAVNKGTLGSSSSGTLVSVILLGVWALILLVSKSNSS